VLYRRRKGKQSPALHTFGLPKSMEITAVIITKNEVGHIARCIASLQGVAAHLLVIDSGSTDGTQALASSLGAEVVQQDWLGYGPQKNVGIDLARHNWILSLDADEVLDETLRASIMALLATKPSADTVYELHRLNYFYGKAVRQGLEFPDWKARLFAKEFARWDGAAVHESLAFAGVAKMQRLEGNIDHYTYATVAEHLSRTLHYARLGAKRLAEEGRTAGPGKMLSSAVAVFIKSYLLRGGWRGGTQGFVLAAISGMGNLMKYAMLWQEQQKRQ